LTVLAVDQVKDARYGHVGHPALASQAVTMLDNFLSAASLVGMSQVAFVQICDVTQVEQVLAHQLVVGFHQQVATTYLINGIFIDDAVVGNFTCVCRLFAHPDPDEGVLFGYRVASYLRSSGDLSVAMWVQRAFAGAV